MLQIRPVAEGELALLGALYEQLMDAPTNLSCMRENFRAMQREGNACVLGVFSPENALVGSVYVIFCRDLVEHCRPFAVVENVIVDQKHRAKGVGRALMRAAEDAARARDCAYMMLVSGQTRTGAHRLYETEGYDVPVRGFKKYL